jgi:hypothetical protein
MKTESSLFDTWKIRGRKIGELCMYALRPLAEELEQEGNLIDAHALRLIADHVESQGGGS